MEKKDRGVGFFLFFFLLFFPPSGVIVRDLHQKCRLNVIMSSTDEPEPLCRKATQPEQEGKYFRSYCMVCCFS